jgi:hypothetical protein
MGEFGGNAGLLSAWYDFEKGNWEYEFQTCRLGVQHVWWAVHIVDLIALVVVVACLCFPQPKIDRRVAERGMQKGKETGNGSAHKQS